MVTRDCRFPHFMSIIPQRFLKDDPVCPVILSILIISKIC